MDEPGVKEDNRFRSESPEQYRLDPLYNHSRYRSLSNSRLSSRLSYRLSALDEGQTLDEFLRKQRVVRYMQEERERAARTRILRDEHNAWIEFRTTERFERLKYMNEQEIQELLQREQREALKEKAAAEIAAKRAAEEAILRRQGFYELSKKEDEAMVSREKGKTIARESHQRLQQDSSQKQVPLDEIKEVRQACLDLQRREADLVLECNRLKDKLNEADKTAASALRDRERAEKELVSELTKSNGGDNDHQAQLQKQVDLLTNQLADLHGKLALTEVDRKRLSDLLEEKNPPRSEVDGQPNNLNAEERKAVSSVNQSVRESVTVHTEREANELKQKQREAEDFKRRFLALQKELAAKDKQIDQYRKQLSVAPKGSNSDAKYPSQKANKPTENDRERQKKDEQEIIYLQKSIEKLQAELRQVSQEKDKLQRALNDRNERAYLMTGKGVVEKADQKAIAVLRKTNDNLLNDRSRDVATIQCLKNELQAAQEELKYETAARAKFEELAAQSIDKNDPAPEAEVVRLRNQLQDSVLKLRQARAEADETRRNAQNEIQELKNWCARLRERQDKQMHGMDLALRSSFADQQRNPRSRGKVQVPDLRMKSTTEKHTGEKLPMRKTPIDERRSGVQERGKNKLGSSETSFRTTTPSPEPDDRVTQMQLIHKLESLEKENAELRRKHDLLVQQTSILKFKDSEEEGSEKPGCKRGLYVERAVQAEEMHSVESVLSTEPNILATENAVERITRAELFNKNSTNVESDIINSEPITAEEKAAKEVIKGNVERVKTEQSGVPFTQASDAEQAGKKFPAFSKIEEKPHSSKLTDQKKKQGKAKCGCH